MSSALDPLPNERGVYLGTGTDGEDVYSLRPKRSREIAAPSQNPNSLFIPIRFQGQYEDAETGLFYNRFRYYDAFVTQYISIDPIRLGGGSGTVGYVDNPTTEFDPFGWANCCCARSIAGATLGIGEEVTGRWLGANGAPVPKSVADALRGQSFSSFDKFREAFWQAVAADPNLEGQFAPQNVSRMVGGKAPIAPVSGHAGQRTSFELDHIVPISQGGAVYDVDNLRVRTPVDHIARHQRDTRGRDGC